MTLDRWHSAPGDQIPAFMEHAVRENDFVIAVCTPRFKKRSDGRGGGVGYEGDIMTAYAFAGGDQRKFIPVLRRGTGKRQRHVVPREGQDRPEQRPVLRVGVRGTAADAARAREKAPEIGRRRDFEGRKSSTRQRQSSATLLWGQEVVIHGKYKLIKVIGNGPATQLILVR